MANEQPIYDIPNCQEDGISSQTELSLSFLDLSITSDLDDEDDDIDFSSGDDYNERRTSRFRLNDVTSVIDEDDEEEDEADENILLVGPMNHFDRAPSNAEFKRGIKFNLARIYF